MQAKKISRCPGRLAIDTPCTGRLKVPPIFAIIGKNVLKSGKGETYAAIRMESTVL